MTGLKQSKPVWISQAAWDALPEADRVRVSRAGKSRWKEAGVTASAPASPKPQAQAIQPAATAQAMNDIRDWAEDVDGISGERLRNCIIFQLDFKKDEWYRYRLTPSYVRAKARKIDGDTPPGWRPPEKNPLIKTVTMKIDDDKVEITMPVRRAGNSEEWQRLQTILLDSKGLVNSNIVPFVVDRDCPLCHGTGFEAVLAHPDNPRLRWQKRSRDCSCLFKNPFV